MGKVQQTSIVTLADVEARADAEYWKEFAEATRALAERLINAVATASAILTPERRSSALVPQSEAPYNDPRFYENCAIDPGYAEYRASHPFAADGRPTCPSKQGKWQPHFPER